MKGWLSVAAVVVGYDAWAVLSDRPTLSAQYESAAAKHPVLVAVATTYVVTHLWGKWPRRADPFVAFGWGVKASSRLLG